MKKSVLDKNTPKTLEILKQEGTNIGIEIISLDHQVLYQKIRRKEDYNQTLSVPIVFQYENVKTPAFLLVRSW